MSDVQMNAVLTMAALAAGEYPYAQDAVNAAAKWMQDVRSLDLQLVQNYWADDETLKADAVYGLSQEERILIADGLLLLADGPVTSDMGLTLWKVGNDFLVDLYGLHDRSFNVFAAFARDAESQAWIKLVAGFRPCDVVELPIA